MISVTIEAGEYSVTVDSSGKDLISASNFGMRNVPGKPSMPAKIFYIAIPPDAEVSNVTFDAQTKYLERSFNIAPGNIYLHTDGKTYESALKEYQENYNEIYSQDLPYPSEQFRYLGTGGFRKYKLVRIEYSPWQYYPLSGLVLFAPQVTVNIEYEHVSKLTTQVNLSDTVREDFAQELIRNYDEAQQWYPSSMAMTTGGSNNYTYIIMCLNATRDAVRPLEYWKRSMGYRVHVFTKEWLQANTAYQTSDFQQQIRYYLRDNYLDWGAEYFLIVADTDEIPMRICKANPDGSVWSPTDTYYGELSLEDKYSWDSNDDGNYGSCELYGVEGDNIDWVMELDVGRIPDNDPAVVQAICEKVRTYEMDTGAWKKRALFLGAMSNYDNEGDVGVKQTDGAEVMEEMMNDWSWPGWTLHTMYENQGLDPSIYPMTWALNQANVRNVWKNGQYALVNMQGHGNSGGEFRRIWILDDGSPIVGEPSSELQDLVYFSTSDLAFFNNNHPSIVHFAGCLCGQYDVPNAIAKEVLHTGGIAGIGGATQMGYTEGWNDESDGRIQTFQYLFNKYLVNSNQRVGTALMSCKTEFASGYVWTYGTQQLLLSQNLFGDPSLNRPGFTERPNLTGHWYTEWDYYVVPRDMNNGQPYLCPVSETLPGNQNSTYLNYATKNSGNITTYIVENGLYIDDVPICYPNCSWTDPGQTLSHNNIGPFTVKGGRHTLKVEYDNFDRCTESNESDNVFSKQYVWSPYELTNQVPLSRSAPPYRGSGYPNCDGFSAELGSGEWWCAVGIIQQNANDNYDIVLYQDYTGSTNGFDDYHVYSNCPGSVTDFVVANRNQTGMTGPYYCGVINLSYGSGGFYIQQSNSPTVTLSTSGSNGPFTIHGNDVVDIYEAYLSVGTWRIILDNISPIGAVDLGLTIYDKAGNYFKKLDYMSGGYSNFTGAGEDESCIIEVTAAGYYGIAVWKSTTADLGDPTNYYLIFTNDATPPLPNPMSWDVEPYELNTSSVTMTAKPASDPSPPVTYLFDFYSSPTGGAGGSDSIWQTGTTYTDVGLSANHQYAYRVKAKDAYINETAWSPISYEFTDIETPQGIIFGTVTSTSIEAKSSNTPSNLNLTNSGLQIDNVTRGTNSGWKHDNNYWTSSSLSPNTRYSFRAKAKNGDGDETGYGETVNKYTLSNIPGVAGFSNVTQTTIQANWTANGNPAGTQYLCENITIGTNSGWTTNLFWLDEGLSTGVTYSYYVKSRNGDGVVASGGTYLGSIMIELKSMAMPWIYLLLLGD